MPLPRLNASMTDGQPLYAGRNFFMNIFRRLIQPTLTKPVNVDKTPVPLKTASEQPQPDADILPTKLTASLIVLPHTSEKAAALAAQNTYVFQVPLRSTKSEIRKVVEQTYTVHVVRVNILRGEGKRVRRGGVRGQRKNWKKALVTLRAGENIQMHAGV